MIVEERIFPVVRVVFYAGEQERVSSHEQWEMSEGFEVVNTIHVNTILRKKGCSIHCLPL